MIVMDMCEDIEKFSTVGGIRPAGLVIHQLLNQLIYELQEIF
jgi:hypothetical protein